MKQNYFDRMAATWGNDVARWLKHQHLSRAEAKEQGGHERRVRKTITLSFSVGKTESRKQAERKAQNILRRPKHQDRQNNQRRGIGV
jgi:hypothetical protein